MHFSTDIIDYFLEYAVKVKAAMHVPESTAKKMQQRQAAVVNSTASWLAASPASSSNSTIQNV